MVGLGLAFMLYALARLLRDAKQKPANRSADSPEFGEGRTRLASMPSERSTRK